MNILETIIAEKRSEVRQRKLEIPVTELEKSNFFSRPVLSLKNTLLDEKKTGIIAEFKRKSPSKGIINDAADIVKLTAAYTAHGASGLSVLTDEKFFGGYPADLAKARVNEIPILRKDFIIDEYQVAESKAMGADVILLIAACLTPVESKKLASCARSLGMEVLLEIHDESEFDHICEETELVGINNRNLKTFRVDIERSLKLSEYIPAGKIKIAESGIDSVENILLFREKGFKGFLIGEYFMKQRDPVNFFADFVNRLKAKVYG